MKTPLENALLLEVLTAHAATDEKERADLDSMRRFATALAEPFSRASVEAHFTGSAVVVTPAGDRVLLLHHAKLRRWLQPGGHAEPGDGEDLALTALREAAEESGLAVRLSPAVRGPLDVDVHRIPARKAEPEHLHLDVRYLVVADEPERLAHDPNEALGAQWLTWDEALARADEPALRRLLEKARAASQRLLE